MFVLTATSKYGEEKEIIAVSETINSLQDIINDFNSKLQNIEDEDLPSTIQLGCLNFIQDDIIYQDYRSGDIYISTSHIMRISEVIKI